MKIAVPTRLDLVDDHFGHCEAYTVFSIDEDNKIAKTEVVPSPQGCGCKSNIATTLKELGVTILLAGNMGDGALNVLNSQGITVFRGCSGNIKQLVDSYVNGEIKDSGIGCQSHGDHHESSFDGLHVCNH